MTGNPVPENTEKTTSPQEQAASLRQRFLEELRQYLDEQKQENSRHEETSAVKREVNTEGKPDVLAAEAEADKVLTEASALRHNASDTDEATIKNNLDRVAGQITRIESIQKKLEKGNESGEGKRQKLLKEARELLEIQARDLRWQIAERKILETEAGLTSAKVESTDTEENLEEIHRAIRKETSQRLRTTKEQREKALRDTEILRGIYGDEVSMKFMDFVREELIEAALQAEKNGQTWDTEKQLFFATEIVSRFNPGESFAEKTLASYSLAGLLDNAEAEALCNAREMILHQIIDELILDKDGHNYIVLAAYRNPAYRGDASIAKPGHIRLRVMSQDGEEAFYLDPSQLGEANANKRVERADKVEDNRVDKKLKTGERIYKIYTKQAEKGKGEVAFKTKNGKYLVTGNGEIIGDAKELLTIAHLNNLAIVTGEATLAQAANDIHENFISNVILARFALQSKGNDPDWEQKYEAYKARAFALNDQLNIYARQELRDDLRESYENELRNLEGNPSDEATLRRNELESLLIDSVLDEAVDKELDEIFRNQIIETSVEEFIEKGTLTTEAVTMLSEELTEEQQFKRSPNLEAQDVEARFRRLRLTGAEPKEYEIELRRAFNAIEFWVDRAKLSDDFALQISYLSKTIQTEAGNLDKLLDRTDYYSRMYKELLREADKTTYISLGKFQEAMLDMESYNWNDMYEMFKTIPGLHIAWNAVEVGAMEILTKERGLYTVKKRLEEIARTALKNHIAHHPDDAYVADLKEPGQLELVAKLAFRTYYNRFKYMRHMAEGITKGSYARVAGDSGGQIAGIMNPIFGATDLQLNEMALTLIQEKFSRAEAEAITAGLHEADGQQSQRYAILAQGWIHGNMNQMLARRMKEAFNTPDDYYKKELKTLQQYRLDLYNYEQLSLAKNTKEEDIPAALRWAVPTSSLENIRRFFSKRYAHTLEEVKNDPRDELAYLKGLIDREEKITQIRVLVYDPNFEGGKDREMWGEEVVARMLLYGSAHGLFATYHMNTNTQDNLLVEMARYAAQNGFVGKVNERDFGADIFTDMAEFIQFVYARNQDFEIQSGLAGRAVAEASKTLQQLIREGGENVSAVKFREYFDLEQEIEMLEAELKIQPEEDRLRDLKTQQRQIMQTQQYKDLIDKKNRLIQQREARKSAITKGDKELLKNIHQAEYYQTLLDEETLDPTRKTDIETALKEIQLDIKTRYTPHLEDVEAEIESVKGEIDTLIFAREIKTLEEEIREDGKALGYLKGKKDPLEALKYKRKTTAEKKSGVQGIFAVICSQKTDSGEIFR